MRSHWFAEGDKAERDIVAGLEAGDLLAAIRLPSGGFVIVTGESREGSHAIADTLAGADDPKSIEAFNVLIGRPA